jgi:predicted RNA-binding Zn ribbon-like protein
MAQPRRSAYRWTTLGGHLALDLCNTVSWRLDPLRRTDRLATGADLIDWFTTVTGTGDRTDLQRQSDVDPAALDRALAGVRALREATHRLIEFELNPAEPPATANTAATPPVTTSPPATALPATASPATSTASPAAVSQPWNPENNRTASDITLVSTAWRSALAVATTDPGLPWRWSVEPTVLDRLVPALALAIADLMHQVDPAKLGRCDGDGCGWLFLDTTRNHSRRWCDPLDCGNRARVRNYVERRRSALPRAGA